MFAGAPVPVAVASPEVRLSYAILNRHLFMNRQDLRLPTCLLLDAAGGVVKVYRDRVDVAEIVKDAAAIDAPPDERLARAVPFAGAFYSGLPLRNYLPYGRELLDQGLDATDPDYQKAYQAQNHQAGDDIGYGLWGAEKIITDETPAEEVADYADYVDPQYAEKIMAESLTEEGVTASPRKGPASETEEVPEPAALKESGH